MNPLTFLLAITTMFSAADARSLRSLRSSSEDVPDIETSRKLESSIRDRILTSLTDDEKERCYAVMDSTAVNNEIYKDGYVEFLNSLAFDYLTDNGITSFDNLSYPLKFAWNTLTCQCKAMGGGDKCCQADRARLFVDGADGEPVSEAQINFLNDVCTTAITTLTSEGWANPPPGELPKPEPPNDDIDGKEIEQQLPGKPAHHTGLTPGAIIAMWVCLPLLAIILLLATLYFCRDKDYKPETEEAEDEELVDVEKENAIDDDDSAIATAPMDADEESTAVQTNTETSTTVTA